MRTVAILERVNLETCTYMISNMGPLWVKLVKRHDKWPFMYILDSVEGKELVNV